MSTEFDKKFSQTARESQELQRQEREQAGLIERMTIQAAQVVAKKISDTMLTHPNLKGAFTRDPVPFAKGTGFKCTFAGTSSPVNIIVSGSVTYDSTQNINMPAQDPSWNAFIVTAHVQATDAKRRSREYLLEATFGVSGEVTLGRLDGVVSEAAVEIAAG